MRSNATSQEPPECVIAAQIDGDGDGDGDDGDLPAMWSEESPSVDSDTISTAPASTNAETNNSLSDCDSQ